MQRPSSIFGSFRAILKYNYMDASLHKSSLRIALLLFFLLFVWKISEILLNNGYGFVVGDNSGGYGRFLSFYIIESLVLVVAPFLIGWLMPSYAKMAGYVKLGLYAFIGVIVIQFIEYVIITRIFGMLFPVSFLSLFIGVLFVAGVFTIFFLLGVRWGIRYFGKLRHSNS